MVVRVAVIGAGASGLVAVRHMSSRLDEFEPVAFEQMPVIGGTWVYSEDLADTNPGCPVHSSMYKHLRTNLPKEVMAFPDFPFPDHPLSFVGHREIRQYLEDYADHFSLMDFIRLNTQVERVEPQEKGTNGAFSWLVRVRSLTRPEEAPTEHVFDAVMVCNGHYTIPLIPDIPGLQKFKGGVIHSHTYRTPDQYRSRRVLVLGAGSSGIDLAIEIAAVAEKVSLCHRNAPLKTSLPPNVTQAPGISRMTSDSAILDDGQELTVDMIVLCTGYHYSFPFLSPDCQVTVTEEERIIPLYKHLIHTRYPTLSFIGIIKVIVPFPAFHCQVLFLLSHLSGKMQLPTKEEMEEEMHRDWELELEKGIEPHIMGKFQWEYNDTLMRLASFEPLPSVYKKLYEKCSSFKIDSILEYRQHNYRVCSSDEFIEL